MYFIVCTILSPTVKFEFRKPQNFIPDQNYTIRVIYCILKELYIMLCFLTHLHNYFLDNTIVSTVKDLVFVECSILDFCIHECVCMCVAITVACTYVECPTL